MVQLVLEFLANGTAPSVIPKNIRSAYWALYDKAPRGGVPSENYCRKFRDVADRFNEIMVSILLTRKMWKSLHTDATTRRQIPFEALVIGLEGKEGEMLQYILVSLCIYMETEDAEGCVTSIERKVSLTLHNLNNYVCQLTLNLIISLNNVGMRLVVFMT